MLDRCPQCDYSLTGLPVEHACPECGLAYDGGSEVFRMLRPGAVFASLAGFVGGFYGIFTLARALGAFGPAWRAVLILCLVAYVGGFAWLAVHLYRLYRRGPAISLLPDGLLIRMQRLEGEWLRWDNIGWASALPKSKSVTLQIKDKRIVRPIVDVFAKPEDARRFASEVNRRILAAAEATREASHNEGPGGSKL